MTPLGNIFLPGKHMNTYIVCVVLIVNLIFHFAESNSEGEYILIAPNKGLETSQRAL